MMSLLRLVEIRRMENKATANETTFLVRFICMLNNRHSGLMPASLMTFA